jgi:hypothetical protein
VYWKFTNSILCFLLFRICGWLNRRMCCIEIFGYIHCIRNGVSFWFLGGSNVFYHILFGLVYAFLGGSNVLYHILFVLMISCQLQLLVSRITIWIFFSCLFHLRKANKMAMLSRKKQLAIRESDSCSLELCGCCLPTKQGENDSYEKLKTVCYSLMFSIGLGLSLDGYAIMLQQQISFYNSCVFRCRPRNA